MHKVLILILTIILIEKPTKEAKAEMEIHPVEAKVRKCPI